MKKKPIQARLDYIKGRFIGKLHSGKFAGLKDQGQGSLHVERERMEEEERRRRREEAAMRGDGT